MDLKYWNNEKNLDFLKFWVQTTFLNVRNVAGCTMDRLQSVKPEYEWTEYELLLHEMRW